MADLSREKIKRNLTTRELAKAGLREAGVPVESASFTRAYAYTMSEEELEERERENREERRRIDAEKREKARIAAEKKRRNSGIVTAVGGVLEGVIAGSILGYSRYFVAGAKTVGAEAAKTGTAIYATYIAPIVHTVAVGLFFYAFGRVVRGAQTYLGENSHTARTIGLLSGILVYGGSLAYLATMVGGVLLSGGTLLSMPLLVPILSSVCASLGYFIGHKAPNSPITNSLEGTVIETKDKIVKSLEKY